MLVVQLTGCESPFADQDTQHLRDKSSKPMYKCELFFCTRYLNLLSKTCQLSKGSQHLFSIYFLLFVEKKAISCVPNDTVPNHLDKLMSYLTVFMFLLFF